MAGQQTKMDALIASSYAALDVISQERTGFIQAVSHDAGFDGIAGVTQNETVTVPVVPDAIMEDSTPSMTTPTPGASVIGTENVSITHVKQSPISWK